MVTLAKEVSVEVIPSVINLTIEEFCELALKYKDAFAAYKVKYFEDRSRFQEFTSTMIAIANNLHTCIESTEKYMQQVRLSMESDVQVSRHRSRVTQQQIIENMDRLNARWNNAVSIAVNYLREEVVVDIDPHLAEIFSRKWLVGCAALETICMTIHDYWLDHRHLRASTRCVLLMDLQFRIVGEYLKAMETRRLTFASYEERLSAGKRLKSDVSRIDALYEELTTGESEMVEQFKSLTCVIASAADVISLRDKSLLSLEATSFARKFPNCPIDLLAAIVASREDVGRSEARTLTEEVTAHVQFHPKDPVFDQLFAMNQQETTEWLPNFGMTNVFSTFMKKDLSKKSTTTSLYMESERANEGEGKEKKKVRRRFPYARKKLHDTTSKGGKKSEKECKFFGSLQGCRNGDNCRYQHVTEKKEPLLAKEDDCAPLGDTLQEMTICKKRPGTDDSIVVVEPPQVNSMNRRPMGVTRPTVERLKRQDLETEAQKRQLLAEIAFFKRRFPKALVEVSADGNTKLEFCYETIDPEWSLTMDVTLAAGHPLVAPKVCLPETSNSRLPEVLRRHLTAKLEETIEGKFKVYTVNDSHENIGKWLLKWLDKHLLSSFVDGLRKTKLVQQAESVGISLVVPSNDKKDFSGPSRVVSTSGQGTRAAQKDREDAEEVNLDDPIELSSSSSFLEKGKTCVADSYPIKMALNWNDSSGNVATLRATSLMIQSKCSRCRVETSHEVPANELLVGWRCEKCSFAQSLRLRPEMVHKSSNLLCRLDARGCRPSDCILLDSAFEAACLACDREDSVQKINYGEVHKSWCRGCHAPIQFSISRIRFLGDSERLCREEGSAAVAISKRPKKTEKNDVLTEGGCLPAMGTCKHYKKSYRWFRFPCCGRLFPCDICHQVSVNNEHEMKLANRIVCGHCSREQVRRGNDDKTDPVLGRRQRMSRSDQNEQASRYTQW
ncbi:unnamed protein product [Caenorhabditis auriculariae]|uniref:C3H1-type domain-containing protein n=1 Tax=Caenorhabditis auriculariae TaxID=2777116 RepID=A0A8S1HVI3_9PELO|nr:unnamed protein product [Caenorhabditis auriculariae]